MLKIVIIRKKTLFIILVIIILLILLAIINIPEKIQKIIYKKEYSEYVQKYALEYNVDENLIYAVIKAESNFKVDAKSSKDAIGLMQLMENTAIEVSGEDTVDLYDAETNIKLGTCYFAKLLEKYNYQLGIALAAYNAGMGNVDTWIERGIIQSDGSDLENIPYKETNMYVRKILNDYQIYKELYQ